MFKNIINFLKKFKLDIFCLIFSISQLGLTKENNEIIKIYEINIDFIHTIIILVTALIIVLSLLLLVAYAILLERKVLGSIQKRRGPNLVGIFGLLQPIADAVKLIVKETIIPVSSNRIIFIVAPLLTLILSLLNWSIIPFSTFAVLADIRVSILMFFAISSLSVYGIIMSGWSSNSKYAFLGALRAAAQVIAYEVSIGLTLIYVLLQSNALNYSKIIYGQIGIWNVVPCFIFFILFFISTLAETNRPPFDLPEAEAELVSGYNVEYSAMAFGFFFLGEYVAIWTVCCLNIILFWGGYLIIFNYQSIYIYSLKVIALVIIFIWIRGSLPRYRYDQLMRLGWKILLPISLGFVILYSGLFYYRVYLEYYDELIDQALSNEYDWLFSAKELYNLYCFFLDLNIIKQNKLNYQFNDIHNYQNIIVKIWKDVKTIRGILVDFEIINNITKYYLDVKSSPIFKLEKYINNEYVIFLKDRYKTSLMVSYMRNDKMLYETTFYYLNNYYIFNKNINFNYKGIVKYSCDFLILCLDLSDLGFLNRNHKKALQLIADNPELYNYENLWIYENDWWLQHTYKNYKETLKLLEKNPELFSKENLLNYYNDLLWKSNYKNYRDTLEIVEKNHGIWGYEDLLNFFENFNKLLLENKNNKETLELIEKHTELFRKKKALNYLNDLLWKDTYNNNREILQLIADNPELFNYENLWIYENDWWLQHNYKNYKETLKILEKNPELFSKENLLNYYNDLLWKSNYKNYRETLEIVEKNHGIWSSEDLLNFFENFKKLLIKDKEALEFIKKNPELSNYENLWISENDWWLQDDYKNYKETLKLLEKNPELFSKENLLNYYNDLLWKSNYNNYRETLEIVEKNHGIWSSEDLLNFFENFKKLLIKDTETLEFIKKNPELFNYENALNYYNDLLWKNRYNNNRETLETLKILEKNPEFFSKLNSLIYLNDYWLQYKYKNNKEALELIKNYTELWNKKNLLIYLNDLLWKDRYNNYRSNNNREILQLIADNPELFNYENSWIHLNDWWLQHTYKNYKETLKLLEENPELFSKENLLNYYNDLLWKSNYKNYRETLEIVEKNHGIWSSEDLLNFFENFNKKINK